jgi:Fe-S-cluster-containing dehydrogenase component
MAGLRARTIAEAACSCTRCVSLISTSTSPAPVSACSNSARVRAPAMQPVHSAMSARVAASMSGSAITSDTANRPPGRSTRAVSRSTRDLSAARLITQLEITTSTLASGSGICSR